MPVFPTFSVTDKASPIASVRGVALTAEAASLAFPGAVSRRSKYTLRPLAATAGATPAEAFIEGIDSFRFRVANTSTVAINATVSYVSSVVANNCVIRISAGATNNAGLAVLLANSTNVKMPTAAVPACVLSVAGENLVFTCTGVAGDTNGRWIIELDVTEVTDLG
jgi:hypothetical protein